VELRVESLGIIDALRVVLGEGLTAITGETGAGKTLVVGALELLLGGRADPGLERDGADEARVEGRFVTADGDEVVLARVVSSSPGARSRAYIDGRLATASELAERGAELVELHGQHTHHSLLTPAEQRVALDHAAGAPAHAALAEYREARTALRRIDDALGALGGDARTRAREIGLLRFQLDEIDAAEICDPGEDDTLAEQQELLANAEAHRDALAHARAALDGPALDAIGAAAGSLADRAPFAALAERVRGLQSELTDLAQELRLVGERLELDPARLGEVRERRHRLHELRRKYGESLAAVLAYGDEVRTRLAHLEGYETRVADLETQRAAALARVERAAATLGRHRRDAAEPLARAVTERLTKLGMPSARFEINVDAAPPGDDGADAVTFLLAANAGEPTRPLAKVASGGELARSMLALRVVLATEEGRATAFVFDEVDAGLGGEAGRAVGAALAELAECRPVLCVTHLAQVAAFADAQIVVEKHTEGGRTVAAASLVLDGARVRELSRMLAGIGDSTHARRHAEELLADAAARVS
ncbi:MAG: DNA repair protein RecN, partial [Acidimicrobiia bacterium]